MKNKTGYTQSVYLKDGSAVTARPHREIEVNGEVANYNKDAWEVQEVVSKTTKK